MNRLIIALIMMICLTGCQFLKAASHIPSVSPPGTDHSIAKNARTAIGKTDQSTHALESNTSTDTALHQDNKATQINNNVDTYHISDTVWALIIVGGLLALIIQFLFWYIMCWSVAKRASRQTPSYLSEHLNQKRKKYAKR